jgi:hypothetical protein
MAGTVTGVVSHRTHRRERTRLTSGDEEDTESSSGRRGSLDGAVLLLAKVSSSGPVGQLGDGLEDGESKDGSDWRQGASQSLVLEGDDASRLTELGTKGESSLQSEVQVRRLHDTSESATHHDRSDREGACLDLFARPPSVQLHLSSSRDTHGKVSRCRGGGLPT